MANGSFESVNPKLTDDGYTVSFGHLATNAVASWDFGISGGNAYDGIVNGPGGNLARNVVTDGSNAAFLQGVGSIAQTVTLPAGLYKLSFYAMGRVPFGPNTIAISFGDLLNETFTPTNSTQNPSDWTLYSYNFIVPQTGAYVLRFSGTIPYFPFSDSIPYSRGSDFTTYIDNISIVASGGRNGSENPTFGRAPNTESASPICEIVFVGDNITNSTAPSDIITDAATTECAKNLSQGFGLTVHISNQADNKFTTTDWRPSSNTNSDFQHAIEAAQSLETQQHGQLIFSIMLGANDSAGYGPNKPVAPSIYEDNLQSMIDQFLVNYPDAFVFLHYPIYRPANGQINEELAPLALKRLHSYLPMIDALVSTNATRHPNRVFAGDKTAIDYFSTNYSSALTPEKNLQDAFSANPNDTDALALGRYWADAIGAVIEKRTTPVRALFQASQIRNLTTSKAAQSLPVHLLGVMMSSIETGSNRREIILQDQTAGICLTTPVDSPDILASFRRGDLLEIEGLTANSEFAPLIQVRLARKLGTTPVPKAQPANYRQLISGASDSQWVEINGVVRQCFKSETKGVITGFVVDVDGGLAQVTLDGQDATGVEPDAEVKVDGICFNHFDYKRRAAVPTLQVPSDVQVVVEKNSPPAPYSAPVRSPASLWASSSKTYLGYTHRIHVRGTVTHAQSGSSIWIRGDNKGLQLLTSQQDYLKPGNVIDGLGFPAYGTSTPHLEDVVFKKLEDLAPPAPINLTNLDEAFDREDDLVSIQGILTQMQSFLNGISLTLDRNGQSFKAVLKTDNSLRADIRWQSGAEVRITGICILANDNGQLQNGLSQPRSFQILLRSPADFEVMKSPPWWNSQHIVLVLGVATGILVIAVSVVVMVSRQRFLLQKRQRQMAEAEFTAIFHERNRLSREIHDTLAQGMTAVLVQLRLAKKHINQGGGIPIQNVDTALTLIGTSLREARNSIWNMRSQVLENSSLSEALEGILKQMANGTEIETGIEIVGRPRSLSPVIENNVLRIGQEAITNAFKYSRARKIMLLLNFGKEQFWLRLEDDGIGFDPLVLDERKKGLGLVGMQERASELNGKLEIRSSRGRGAEIILCIPLMKI